jgi:hypothetical protein
MRAEEAARAARAEREERAAAGFELYASRAAAAADEMANLQLVDDKLRGGKKSRRKRRMKKRKRKTIKGGMW